MTDSVLVGGTHAGAPPPAPIGPYPGRRAFASKMRTEAPSRRGQAEVVWAQLTVMIRLPSVVSARSPGPGRAGLARELAEVEVERSPPTR